jgi:hypothetical protein
MMMRTKLWWISSLAVLTASVGANHGFAQEYLNGIEWKEPAIVTPGSTNSDPPSDAVVLFDGKDKSHWTHSLPDAVRSPAPMSLGIAKFTSSGRLQLLRGEADRGAATAVCF